MRVFLLVVILFQSISLISQNLIPNPSFEEFTLCPDNHSQLNRCKYWKNATTFSTCDYFNACDITGYVSVPSNMNGWGYQAAKSGNAYAGFHALTPAISQDDAYEYLKVELLNILDAGEKYFVSLYINKPNYTNHVINTIGVYFTNNDTLPQTGNRILVEPDIEHSYPLIDTVNWTKIEGSFVAEGTERIVIIGNFKDRVSSGYNLVMSNGGNGAYYYIDDVCVSLNPADCGIDTNTTSITDVSKPQAMFKVFPNPAREILNLTYLIGDNKNISVAVINVLGQEMIGNKQLNIYGADVLNTSELTSGVYFLKIYSNHKLLETKKFLICR